MRSGRRGSHAQLRRSMPPSTARSARRTTRRRRPPGCSGSTTGCGVIRSTPERVTWLGSGNMAVRRSAFEEVGGFDTTLETCEDVDLCRKLRARGYVTPGRPADGQHPSRRSAHPAPGVLRRAVAWPRQHPRQPAPALVGPHAAQRRASAGESHLGRARHRRGAHRLALRDSRVCGRRARLPRRSSSGCARRR